MTPQPASRHQQTRRVPTPGVFGTVVGERPLQPLPELSTPLFGTALGIPPAPAAPVVAPGPMPVVPGAVAACGVVTGPGAAWVGATWPGADAPRGAGPAANAQLTDRVSAVANEMMVNFMRTFLGFLTKP